MASENMEIHAVTDDDSTLENMTSALLEVSSVFFVQQNELQEVRDRLQKELGRVTRIQDALMEAAQEHHMAVLNVVQNYENLATEVAAHHPGGMPEVLRISLAPKRAPLEDEVRSRRISSGGGGTPSRRLNPPPDTGTVETYLQQPPEKTGGGGGGGGDGDSDSDDGGGIKYVDKVQVVGGILGVPLVASGEFVGEPSVQWFRSAGAHRAGSFVEIEGATSLEYTPTAEDVGSTLKLECVGPYGGDTARVFVTNVGVDPATRSLLEGLLRRGYADFSAVSCQDCALSSAPSEPRILLVTRKNIKVRERLSRLVSTASTLYKQFYDKPLTLKLDEHVPTEARCPIAPEPSPAPPIAPRARSRAHALSIRLSPTLINPLLSLCADRAAPRPTHLPSSTRVAQGARPRRSVRPHVRRPRLPRPPARGPRRGGRRGA